MIKEVIVENEIQLKYVLERDDIKNIILSIDSFDDKSIIYYIDKINNMSKNAYLRLERITRKYNESYEKYVNNENVKGFLIENMDSLSKLLNIKNADKKIIELDYTMNICNDEAKNMYDNIGRFRYTYPIELSAYDMRKLKMDTLIVYTDLPTMVSANCAMNTQNICKGDNTKPYKLSFIKDRKGKKVYHKSYCKCCYSKIFNPDYYYIVDLLKKDKDIKNLDYKKIRYEFSILEDIKKIEKILDGNIDTSDKSKENFTRGHIRKSIQ